MERGSGSGTNRGVLGCVTLYSDPEACLERPRVLRAYHLGCRMEQTRHLHPAAERLNRDVH